MNNFMCLATGMDVTPLVLAIKRRPELWKEDTYLRDFPGGPFAEIESILLRFPVKKLVPFEDVEKELKKVIDPHESIDYPPYKLLPEARQLIMPLMARSSGERLGRCMINKIPPGGKIAPHADTPEHAEYYSRFHIVLQSAPGVLFRAGNEQVYMATGDVWWFNNKLEHEVINNSAIDRIHLIVDIRTSR
ncbi:MAG: aspartyl/asparaginyl beta-hydroxylase domain-containing protein [Pseudomonadota bacterium]